MSDKLEESRKLAEAHYRVEPGITQIYRITGGAEAEVRPDEPIKLLEVNENTIPSGIMPLGFGPAPAHGIHFPSIIVEVTPEEFDRIRSQELPLPGGWEVSDLVPRPPVDGDE
jgi:hypothetical protein